MRIEIHMSRLRFAIVLRAVRYLLIYAIQHLADWQRIDIQIVMNGEFQHETFGMRWIYKNKVTNARTPALPLFVYCDKESVWHIIAEAHKQKKNKLK